MNYLEFIISGAISLILACMVQNYVSKKQNKYSDNKEKCNAIIDFVILLVNKVHNQDDDIDDLLSKREEVVRNCLIYGSNQLIRKWDKAFEISSDPNATVEEKLFCIERAINTLRKNCGHYIPLPKGAILRLFGVKDLKK